MDRRLLIILTLLTSDIAMFSQHDFGIKLNGGLSTITNSYSSPNVTSTVKPVLSGQGGFFYNYSHGKYSTFAIELLFVQVGRKQHDESPVIDNNGPTGELIKTDSRWNISYFGIPIYYGFKLKKFTINLGFQTNFLLASSGRYVTTFPYNGSITTWDNSYNELAVDNYDCGPRAGIIFKLYNKFSVEATYYYGVNNIYRYSDNISGPWIWKVQQLTFGLRYNIWTNKIKCFKTTTEEAK